MSFFLQLIVLLFFYLWFFFKVLGFLLFHCSLFKEFSVTLEITSPILMSITLFGRHSIPKDFQIYFGMDFFLLIHITNVKRESKSSDPRFPRSFSPDTPRQFVPSLRSGRVRGTQTTLGTSILVAFS